jgi:hypothetical protein
MSLFRDEFAMNSGPKPKLTPGTPYSNDSDRLGENSFHVFLSRGRTDAQAIETIAARLEDQASLHPFLDPSHLISGEPWKEELEAALDHSQTCAAFIGPAGLGPWENEEMRSALGRTHQTFRLSRDTGTAAHCNDAGTGRIAAFSSAPDLGGLSLYSGLARFQCFWPAAGIRGKPPGPAPGIEPSEIVECLYRGFQAFDEEDARRFLGATRSSSKSSKC